MGHFGVFFHGKGASDTACPGIACCPSDGRDGRNIPEQAGEAPYCSKQGGRNRKTTSRRSPPLRIRIFVSVY